jgi:hypothetical protein
MSVQPYRLPATPPAVEASTALGSGAGQRSLQAYLVLPRPGDVGKWVIIPASFCLGILTVGSVSGTVALRAMLVWLAIEFLVYQARYQWNDIRGFAADQLHPHASSRGRLPGPIERSRRHVPLSAAVAVGRLLTATSLPLLLPRLDLAAVLYTSAFGVFAAAFIYEAIRAVPAAPIEPAAPQVRPIVAALWIVSGLGYAVRGLTGLALAVNLRADWRLAVLLGLTFWVGGIGFVTARWAVESLAFASGRNGKVTWRANAVQAREHVLGLTRWIGAPTEAAPLARSLRDWRPLKHASSPSAPWNLAALVKFPVAAASGVALACLDRTAPPAAWLVLPAASLLCAVLIIRRPTAAYGIGTLLVLAACAVALGLPRPWLAVLPSAIAIWLYLTSMHQSLSDIGRTARRARELGLRLLSHLGRLVLGRRTWDLLTSDVWQTRTERMSR